MPIDLEELIGKAAATEQFPWLLMDIMSASGFYKHCCPRDIGKVCDNVYADEDDDIVISTVLT